MTTIAADPLRARRLHQHEIDKLLNEIDLRRQQLYRLSASGVQRAGMRELKHELRELRRNLGDSVAG